MTTATQHQIPLIRRMRSLEVRWILPGQLEPVVAGWFARFPAWVEAREDSYLADPPLGGLSVKLRAGRALEVKVYQGSPGILDVAGRARGRLECWEKWSFPCGPPSRGGVDRPGWRPVRKLIRRFALTSGHSGAGVPGPGEDAGCQVELTEICARGQAWWTLALEATGPASLRRNELEATAALVFAQALPGSLELGTDDSQSYAQWLTSEPSAQPRPRMTTLLYRVHRQRELAAFTTVGAGLCALWLFRCAFRQAASRFPGTGVARAT